MSLTLRVIEATELEEILVYEQMKMKETITDEVEQQFASWHSRARKEALQHYLPTGWCFLARDKNADNQIVGYFLAQPLLFFEGQTQSLWVEHLQFSSLQARDELCDLAYRLSREKHFQRVYFPNTPGVANSVNLFKPADWNPQTLMLKTSKA